MSGRLNYIELVAGYGEKSLGLEAEKFKLYMANGLPTIAGGTFAHDLFENRVCESVLI